MQHLTWDALRQAYPEDRYIFLLPQVDMHVQHSIPLWRLDVATVKIDPNDPSQVYAVEGTAKRPVKLALQRPALDRLLAAANGVSRAHVVYEIPGELVRYEGVAAMKAPDGSIRPIARTRDWVGSAEREAIEAQVEKWYADNETYADRTWWHKLSPEQKQAKKAEEIATRWRRERQFGSAKTESKAIGRAIRALLGLRGGFTPSELAQKSFAVPRWVFEPPVDNPEVLKQVVDNAFNGQHLLYGATSQLVALPSSPIREPLQLTGGEIQTDDALDGVPPAGDSGFSPPPAEPERPPLMSWADLQAKIASATCAPHLDNVERKYRPAAEQIGAAMDFAAEIARRRAEFGGHAPAPVAQPSAEDLRRQEIAGLVQSIERELGVRQIGAGQRANLAAQLARFRDTGSLDSLRDMLLWIEGQPQGVRS